MKRLHAGILALVSGVLSSGSVLAAGFGTYVLGTTGLKNGSMPPPGVYAINLAFEYRATDFRNENGDRVSQVNGEKFSGKAEARIDITSITYVSKLTLFGANYGARIAMLSGEANVEAHQGSEFMKQHVSGIGGLYLEPLNLSWHLPRFDFFTSYGLSREFFGPSDPNTVDIRWTHLFSAGMSAYLDAKHDWAFSIVPRFEFFQHDLLQDSKAGGDALAEWGLCRSFTFMNEDKKSPRFMLDVGPVGYAEWQVLRGASSAPGPHPRFSVYAAGAEIGATVPKWHLARFTLRCEQEFFARSRPQGIVGAFRFSIKF